MSGHRPCYQPSLARRCHPLCCRTPTTSPAGDAPVRLRRCAAAASPGLDSLLLRVAFRFSAQRSRSPKMRQTIFNTSLFQVGRQSRGRLQQLTQAFPDWLMNCCLVARIRAWWRVSVAGGTSIPKKGGEFKMDWQHLKIRPSWWQLYVKDCKS